MLPPWVAGPARALEGVGFPQRFLRVFYRVLRSIGLIKALVLLNSLPLLATSIILVKTPEGIAIAADSKMREVGHGDKTIPSSDHVCKIHAAGSYYWAAANLVLDLNTGYDIKAVVSGAAKNGQSLNELARSFETSIVPILEKEIAVAMKTNPDYFRSMLTGNEAILEIAFLGVERGQPAWKVRQFRCRNDGGHCVIRMVQPRTQHKLSAEDVQG